MHDERFEQILVAMTHAIELNRRGDIPDRLLATFVLKAILEAGFVPIKSITDLTDHIETVEKSV
jgi:hypothetical protein